jgi:FkbM family methyltransferase
MAERVVLVVAANSNYFEYLRDLVLSFKECGGDRRCDLAVLDVGLNTVEQDWLKRNVALILKPNWPLAGLAGQPEWFKTMICRPFFPNYFSDWDIIISIDADSWFQDLRAIELAISGVHHSNFAVVPHIDRCYWQASSAGNSLVFLEWQKQSLAQGFGDEVAEAYYRHPSIAAGFFAGHKNAPHWKVWQSLIASALNRNVYFSAEQAALSLTVHREGLLTQFLPSYCHWMGHAGAIGINTNTGYLTESHMPYEPISVVALAANSKVKPQLANTHDGRTVARSLRFNMTQVRLPLQVTRPSGTISCDGIASVRFRESIYARLSRSEETLFLQIGAMDGVSFDPIYPFVTQYGWRGVLVEPLPDMMERLKANYAGVKGVRFAEVAISASSGTQKMFRIKADGHLQGSALPEWSQGISSLKPSRNALGGHTISPTLGAQLKAATIEVEVATLSFADLAESFDLSNLDVIQIDAEGSDWEILEQMDIAASRPKTLQIEVQCLPPEEIALAIEKLRAAGYYCYLMEDGADLFSVRHDVDKIHAGRF